jgi:hypothetical protein
MITYILHQLPVSGHNHCEGIVVEIEPLSSSSGKVVRMTCCWCCRDEQLEKGTIINLPLGQNWKRASNFSMGEDATVIKPRDLKIPQPEDPE